MFRNVDVTCAHCGESKTIVPDAEAIPEVPATYEASAAERHRTGPAHKMSLLRANVKNAKEKNGKGPERNNITGRLSEMEHGKDHNA